MAQGKRDFGRGMRVGRIRELYLKIKLYTSKKPGPAPLQGRWAP